ncbi:MAG: hypothetical protein EXR91_12825 [Gemmatimonadetes bacterium]|nr:hypothetical protein [Gemmatimonadota bacterium]
MKIVVENHRMGLGGDVALGDVLRLYLGRKSDILSPAWLRASKTRRDLFEAAWGAGKLVDDITESDIDDFTRLRRRGVLGANPVKDGTIEADLRWLNTVFRWARGHKINRRPLIAGNPLDGIKRPKEQKENIRRPASTHERYLATLEKADEVDPRQRLRCMLVLARYTGHRLSAIRQLRVSDILRTRKHVEAAIAALGEDLGWVDQYPNGGIRWRGQFDKVGVTTITPIPQAARDQLIAYVDGSARVGEAWLFPSPVDDTKPVRKELASDWLARAEKLAELPKISGGLWHPYRRLWANERKHLPTQDVAFGGGWHDTSALTTIYQRADAEGVRRVVDLEAS